MPICRAIITVSGVLTINVVPAGYCTPERTAANGAERKLMFEVSCFRFCPHSRPSRTNDESAEQGGFCRTAPEPGRTGLSLRLYRPDRVRRHPMPKKRRGPVLCFLGEQKKVASRSRHRYPTASVNFRFWDYLKGLLCWDSFGQPNCTARVPDLEISLPIEPRHTAHPERPAGRASGPEEERTECLVTL
jgi:hypothetical protein